ncbi:putative uncharacterized protein SERTAD4-AS1 [Carlito syrichta]|uniref:Uncharacterized protein n=1 Tax=Carlito syrichta TaxID=1868482 RepID=A0A3Q0E8Z3_CARSF|nr:putative uncharacterized protein SERTAD4-AS1 [Carlito syrichta]
MTHGGWQGSGEAGPSPALQPAADARPALPPSPARPAGSPRLPERPVRAETRRWGRPPRPRSRLSLPLCFCGRSRALGKVAGAEEAGGEEGRREAEAWTRRAAASARRGVILRL